MALTDPLRISGLAKSFGTTCVLRDISFELPAGASLSIIGPSGCGKSTLLSIVAGLNKADEGQVLLPERCRSAFILQDYGLFPWKTVRDNLALPLQLQGVPRRERFEAAQSMLEELGLDGLSSRYPVQLSGGQRQRVAIGRALISKPDLLLMDEPFAALDAITREHLQNQLLEVWKRHRMSFMLVTHNVAEAVFLGRYIMVLGGKPAGCALWVENPCFGDASSRNSDAYFSLIRKVHEALESAQEDEKGEGENS